MQHFHRYATLALTIALASGCSKTPVREGLFELGASTAVDQTIFNAIPADVAYAYAFDLTAVDAAQFERQMNSPMWASLQPAIVETFGVDLISDGGFEALGIDTEGEIALFSTSLAPVLFAKLSDSDRFIDAMNTVRERNPDLEWSEFDIAGIRFRGTSVDAGEDVYGIDYGVVAGYAVVRFRTGYEALDLDDDALERAITGQAGPALITDARVTELRSRGRGSQLTGLVLVDPARVWNTFAASPLHASIGEYESASQQAACDQADAALFAAIPWAGMSRVMDPERPERSKAYYIVDLSDHAASVADAVLSGAALSTAEHAAEAAFYATANVDIVAAINSISGDPELRNCPSPAAIGGHLAHLRDTSSATIEQLTHYVTGAIALGLFDVNLSGFIPRIDLALMLGTNNPIDLITQFQNLIESRGGQGTVDDTSPHITMDYQLLGFSIRLIQRDDRIVIRTGNVPPPVEISLAADDLGNDDDFAHGQINGPRLAALLESVYGRLGDMIGGLDASGADAAIQTYRNMRFSTAEFELRQGQLSIEVDTELDLDAIYGE